VIDTGKRDVLNSLQVKEGLEFGRYLGVPSRVGRRKKATFNYIKE